MLVTPLVNPVNPHKTLDENEETLLTTDAAKADPGIEGKELLFPPGMEGGVLREVLTVDVDPVDGLITVGSYRHHHDGVGINTGPLKVSLVRSSYFLSSMVQSMTSS